MFKAGFPLIGAIMCFVLIYVYGSVMLDKGRNGLSESIKYSVWQPKVGDKVLTEYCPGWPERTADEPKVVRITRILDVGVRSQTGLLVWAEDDRNLEYLSGVDSWHIRPYFPR